MSHTMKNQSTELAKQQRLLLARAIQAIIEKTGSENTDDTAKSAPKTQSVVKPRQKSAFAKRRNLNKLSIRIWRSKVITGGHPRSKMTNAKIQTTQILHWYTHFFTFLPIIRSQNVLQILYGHEIRVLWHLKSRPIPFTVFCLFSQNKTEILFNSLSKSVVMV